MLNLFEYINIIIKNFIYLIIFLFLSLIASYFYVNQSLKPNTNTENIYSDVIISTNHISSSYIEEINLILLELNAINKISNMLVDYPGQENETKKNNHTYQFIEIDSVTKKYNNQYIISILLDSLMNRSNLKKNYLAKISDTEENALEIIIDNLSINPKFADNGDIREILISYNGKDSEIFFNNLIDVLEYSISEKLLENLVRRVNKVTAIKEYYKEVNLNFKKIKETQLFEQTIKSDISSSGILKDEIMMQKLLSEIDLKVIDNKLELISDNTLENKLIENIEEFFKIEPKLLKRYSILFQTFTLKKPTYFFVYVVSAIISVFIFLIFIFIKEVRKLDNNN